MSTLLLIDIDECITGNHNCDGDISTCTNVVGSYDCTCNEGYEASGDRTCVGMVHCS